MKKILQGVYKITNRMNNHCYIGSSVDIKKRWREHRARCMITTKNYKHTYYSHFYCALRKYGRDNFDYDILELVDNPSDLLEREKYWYFYYKPEYNQMIPDRVNDYLGKPHTEETKRKISQNNARYWSGKKLPRDMINKIIEGNKTKRKQVVMYDLDTKEILYRFDGICNALKFLNHNPNNTQSISDCCKGKTKSAYGYYWTFDE